MSQPVSDHVEKRTAISLQMHTMPATGQSFVSRSTRHVDERLDQPVRIGVGRDLVSLAPNDQGWRSHIGRVVRQIARPGRQAPCWVTRRAPTCCWPCSRVRALTAKELAIEGGVSRSTASTHLARLEAGGLIQVARECRHRYFRLAGADVAELLERLLAFSARAGRTRTRRARGSQNFGNRESVTIIWRGRWASWRWTVSYRAVS